MLASDWAQKMLCNVAPNRRTASPEFFSWVRRRRLLTRSRLVWLTHQRNALSQESLKYFIDSILKCSVYIKLKDSWLSAFLWCVSQTSRRVRTHEKNSEETVRRLGTIIQSNVCAQSGTSIPLTVWKWSGESRYPGALLPMLENFRRAF